MKIKKLDILGFKSFVDKASLDFQQGITSVVGPNGCGKSNIVDAIRWVMGEQSAKNLRGASMEDVIFIGSEGRKALGMAEVSITFSTEDGRVPAKYLAFNEIQVTRRLYRDGESEYFINKTPCRLMDITELFMDTGVGTRAYSVIEQGKIGMILHSKPEERRFIIEEAAGISKFKSRKKLALRKIDVTKQNLLRIGDIVGEIRRQMNGLQRQAKKAENFRLYREELREIELQFAVREFIAHTRTRSNLEGELSGIKEREESLVAAVEAGELSLEEQRIALLEEEKKLTLAQEEIYRVKGDLQAFENRTEFQRKELANLERHRTRMGEELASLDRQFLEAEAEKEAIEKHSGQYLQELGDEEMVLEAKEADVETLAASEGELSRRLDESRRSLFSILNEIAQWSNQQAAAAKKLEGIEERAERSRREALALQEKLAETARGVGELEEARRNHLEMKEGLTEQANGLRSREEELRVESAAAEKRLQALRDSLSSKSSRLGSLRELEAQLTGYGRGVRAILLSDKFKERFSCTVADILETDERYETAVEAALGETLQYIIGAAESDAVEAVGFLSEGGGGRGTFLLPGTVAMVSGNPPAERLLDRVTVDEKFRDLISPLLADAYLARDLSEAISLGRRFPMSTFATMNGDVVKRGGIVSGGRGEGEDEGLIHKKREIKDLSREVAELAASVQTVTAERERMLQELRDIEAELRDVRQRLHNEEIQLVNSEKDLQRAHEEKQRVEERLAIKGMDDDQLREDRESLFSEMEEADSRRKECDERRLALEAEVERVRQELESQKEGLAKERELVTTLKVRVASLRERRDSSIKASKRIEELLLDLSSRIEGRRKELALGEQDRERLSQELSKCDETMRDLVKKQMTAEAAFTSSREAYESRASIVREEEIRLKGLRSEHDAVRQTGNERALRISEASLAIQHISLSMQEKFRVDVENLVPHCSDDWDESAFRVRQGELQRLIDDLGEVNLMAVDEYRQLEERHNFLVSQQEDLQESMQALQQAIQRINRTTRRRFQETFELVNAKFQEVFPRLFCGGSAELRLTNEEDLLETGIDIIAQPPGKKLQNITALSGGEKALTAVALIFAIFLIKPSPFCLLDEVDAPLDDANIGRFNDIVREMSAISQFIIITHNKTTMAIADTLYGVTMEEPGVSKLVSVRLNQ